MARLLVEGEPVREQHGTRPQRHNKSRTLSCSLGSGAPGIAAWVASSSSSSLIETALVDRVGRSSPSAFSEMARISRASTTASFAYFFSGRSRSAWYRTRRFGASPCKPAGARGRSGGATGPVPGTGRPGPHLTGQQRERPRHLSWRRAVSTTAAGCARSRRSRDVVRGRRCALSPSSPVVVVLPARDVGVDAVEAFPGCF